MKLLPFAPVCLCAAAIALGQGFPGQYPRSPFPGGQGPTGGPVGRGPNGRGTGGPVGGGPSRSGRSRNEAVIPVSTLGTLRAMAGGRFVMEADDHRIITYKLTDGTTITKDGAAVELTAFSPGSHITVDSTADDKGFFSAVAVTFNSAGTADDRAAAMRTWDLPDLASRKSAKRDSDDDRPVLRREPGGVPSASGNAPQNTARNTDKNDTSKNPSGQESNSRAAAEPERPATVVRAEDPEPDADDPGRPALRRRSAARAESAASENARQPTRVALPDGPYTGDSSQPVAPPTPVPAEASGAAPPGAPALDQPSFVPVEEDPVIQKAREAASAFAEALPNFFAKQAITRYDSEGKSGWRARDLISADVAYEDGNETYKNITVGGKTVKKSMEDLDGTWSTGQFQGLLEEIFNPGTAATFRKGGQETIRGRASNIFKFDVKRQNSRWRINAGSQLYFPAYRGSLWIDKETSRVLRLEMQARNIPLLFPFDKAESATDYDLIRLSSPQRFLLPISAEVLDCEVGTSRCSRNRIEYRNYRKFGAESDVTFDDGN